jgi:hypothetical protein
MSVCPHLNLVIRWTDFYEIRYWAVSLKFVDVLQFLLKSDNGNGQHMKTHMGPCAHLERNSLIFISERKKCFEQKF